MVALGIGDEAGPSPPEIGDEPIMTVGTADPREPNLPTSGAGHTLRIPSGRPGLTDEASRHHSAATRQRDRFRRPRSVVSFRDPTPIVRPDLLTRGAHVGSPTGSIRRLRCGALTRHQVHQDADRPDPPALDRATAPRDPVRPRRAGARCRVTAPSPWMFAAPAITPAVRRQGPPPADGLPHPPSKTSPYHPNRLAPCARRSDDTNGT
jgi:hypothetical protein